MKVINIVMLLSVASLKCSYKFTKQHMLQLAIGFAPPTYCDIVYLSYLCNQYLSGYVYGGTGLRQVCKHSASINNDEPKRQLNGGKNPGHLSNYHKHRFYWKLFSKGRLVNTLYSNYNKQQT